MGVADAGGDGRGGGVHSFCFVAFLLDSSHSFDHP